MRVRRFVLVTGLVLVWSLVPTAARAEGPTFQELEESLTCQCGCGLTVHSCNHLQCGSALPLRDEIREHMAEGGSKDVILAHFRDKYGEKILSAPTTSGFNLVAWVTPFALVGAGAVFLALTVRRWRRRPEESPAEPPAPSAIAGASKEHQKILERELRRFDE